ncbi:MAG: flavin reductase family protein, partial [Candidatus Heimdallarchaeota archaeon]
NQNFSLSFFDSDYRSILNFCGAKSGRNINKMEEVALTPIEREGTIYFEEARLVLICKKLYYHDLEKSHFLHDLTEQFYKQENFHRMYIGEIVSCLLKKNKR